MQNEKPNYYMIPVMIFMIVLMMLIGAYLNARISMEEINANWQAAAKPALARVGMTGEPTARMLETALCDKCPHAWQENVKFWKYGSHAWHQER